MGFALKFQVYVKMKELKMKFRWETEFKETEIGEIPREWEVEKAIEHIEFIRGIEPGSKFYKDFGKYKFIRVGNLSGERNDEVFIDIEVENEKIANKNDILISFDGTVGVVRKGLEGVFSSGIRKIKIKEQSIAKLNYEFLYWFFKSTIKYQIFGFSDEKTTIAHASESIPYLKIFIPPPPEQSRIATVLSWFDDLIEVKKRQNEILEKTAMAIFKSWFIDFEPFRDGEFVYSEELGKEIPKGWEVKKIGEIAEIIMGQSPPSKFYNEDGIGIPFIQGKGQLGKYTPQTTIFCSCDGKLARAYDILLTVRAPVGELNLADKEYIIGRGIASIRSNYWPFLFLYFNFNRELLKSLEKGTTYDAIVKEDIENLLIVIPPSHILQSFHSLVEPLFQKIILNQKQIMTLRKIRDTILPLLVFGKLRVEEV
jgi:Restriction endonuclease S subunits